MVRIAHVVAGVVVNISIADKLHQGDIDGADAHIGDLYADGVFSRPEPVAAVPQAVLPRQFRIALEFFGLLDAVEAAVDQQDKVARITWEYAVTIERNHPLLAAMAAGLGVTKAQLDEIFIYAATVK